MDYTPLQQSAPYALALQALGADVHRIGGVLAIRRRLPLLGRVTYLPRAALPDDLRGVALINAPCRTQDHLHRAAGHVALMTPQTLAVLDLRPKDATRRAAQHGKWRNRLRRAEASPLHLVETRFDPLHHGWLLRHEARQRRARGYRALPPAFVTAYPAPHTLLIQAHHAGSPVAAMLFLLHGTGATYHIGWTSPEGRALNAHPLILWHASQTLRARGVRALELGPLDTDAAPALARFKLGSGAKPRRLGHSWLHLPPLSPLCRTFRRGGGFPSGLLS